MPEVASISLLNELEARQDDVLRQLDELDVRITAVIAEFAPKLGAKSAGGELPTAAQPNLRRLATAIEMPRLADGPQQPHADSQTEKAA